MGFPKAQKILFGQRTKGRYGSSFELDIYIPELRKGIEFNGTYWHSEKGLRRSRPNWPDDMLKNYHNLKKDFFAKRGIEYLEIPEEDWITNRESCLASVYIFLAPPNLS